MCTPYLLVVALYSDKKIEKAKKYAMEMGDVEDEETGMVKRSGMKRTKIRVMVMRMPLKMLPKGLILVVVVERIHDDGR